MTLFLALGSWLLPSTGTQTSVQRQEFVNNLVAESTQKCSVNVSQTIKGETIIIQNSRISGDLNLASESVSGVDASCTMTNNMEAQVMNILEVILKQGKAVDTSSFGSLGRILENLTSFLKGRTVQDAYQDLAQSVVNNILQVNNATCQAEVMQLAQNNLYYITDTDVGGDLNADILTTSNVRSNCVVNNSMKMQIQNKAQSDTVQGEWRAASSPMAILGTLITIIAAAIGIWILLKSRKREQNMESQSVNPYMFPQ